MSPDVLQNRIGKITQGRVRFPTASLNIPT